MLNSVHNYVAIFALFFALFNTLNVALKVQNGFQNSYRKPSQNSQIIDDKSENLAWFVQVSDLHFSIFQDFDRSQDFRHLCQFINKVLRPSAMILTGDLTDAKAKDKLGSRQFEAEWKLYRETMEFCGAFDSNWLDVRGNHDTFNTKNQHYDYYAKYGIRQEKRTYSKIVKANNVSIGFVAVDATLNPGPKRPFNFFGSLSPYELSQFQDLLHKTAQNSDYQIVFGHYPTSCILSPNPSVRQIISENDQTLAYLCGHLHTLNGMAPFMYSSQPEGFLELELGDWKDNRIFRAMAIDQGQLVFQDFHYNQNLSTIALVLNPIDMSFITFQDFKKVQESTHLRVLVLSAEKIQNLQVIIDNDKEFNLEQSQSLPNLYVSKWHPQTFQDGAIHKLQVILNQNKVLTSTQFALSPSQDLGFTGLLPKIVLYFNWSLVTQALFGLCTAIIVIPLCLIRHFDPKNFKFLNRVVQNDKWFFPLILAPLFIALGPWTLGYLLDDDLGLLFSWGLLIDGHILPADVTHLYGLFFMFPYIFMLILALGLKRRQRPGENFAAFWLKTNWLFVLLMILQVFHCVEFYLCYGVLATVFGICGLGRIFFVYYLWRSKQ